MKYINSLASLFMIVGLVPSVAFGVERASNGMDQELNRVAYLKISQEQVKTNSPDALYEKFESENGFHGESTTDGFYKDYANNLQTFTNNEFPHIVQFRQPLITVTTSFI